MSSINNIDERYDHEIKTQGKFALSIGTSLAIETIFNVNDNVPPINPPPFKSYQYLYVNVRTLIRNMNGAVLKELKTVWSVDKYLEELTNELDTLPEIINDYSKGKMQVVFYIDTYKDIKKHYPNAILRQTKGPVALAYEALENELVNLLLKTNHREKHAINVYNCKVLLPKEKVLLFSHIPMDLIPYAHTSRCDLLESHTGAIKDRYKWFTKLNSSGLERVPFGKFSIQVFGDSKHFAGLSHRYKRALIDVAKDSWWSQDTTDKLMKTGISRIKDKEIVSVLLKLF